MFQSVIVPFCGVSARKVTAMRVLFVKRRRPSQLSAKVCTGGKVADALLNHGDVGVLCADKVHPRSGGEREQYDQGDDADGQAGAALLATVLDLLRIVGDGGRVDDLRGGEKLLAFHPRERFAAAGAGFEMIVHESAARVRAAFVGVER